MAILKPDTPKRSSDAVLNIRIPSDLKGGLEYRARRLGVSVGRVARLAIAQYLGRQLFKSRSPKGDNR